jgi:glycosyltransferase involved in cell wall biosynthesis
MSASRNLGIQHARGRYVSYLDGDDVWMPEKLTEQVALIEAHPQAAMVFGPLEMWHSWSEDGADDYQYGVPRGELHPLHDRLVEPPEILCRFLERENLLPGGVLARREVLERAVGEDAFRDANSDAIVHTKVCLRWAVYIAAKSWYRYRQHPQSTTKIAAAQGLRRENRLRFLTWVGDYLASEQVDDERVWRAWEQALWRCRHPLRFRLRHLIRRSRSLEAWIGLAGRAQPLLRAPAQRRRATPP